MSTPGKACWCVRHGAGSSAKVIEALADVMVMKGVPEHIRSDNGPEFVSSRSSMVASAATGAKTLYIGPARQSVGERLLRIVVSTRSSAMSSSTERSSARSRRCRCWQNAGASTTTPSGRTLRWATDRPPQRRGNTRSKQGMEKWKANYASHYWNGPPPEPTRTDYLSWQEASPWRSRRSAST